MTIPGETAVFITIRAPWSTLEGNVAGCIFTGGRPVISKTCVVVTERWDQLFEAIAQEKDLSFSIAE